ncbi:hypothetical protein LINPERHAP2_LOCUS7459 [Linum perenne]
METTLPFGSDGRVWVRLPGLPFEYFDANILQMIGDSIGKTVRIDHTTLEGSKGNFARMCVEVDLAKPLLSKYRLRCRVRRIEYEGLHIIYFNFGCYGHRDEACSQKKVDDPDVSMDPNDAQTSSFMNPIFQGLSDLETWPEVEEDFGPWMQVKKHKRKVKQTLSPTPPAPS